jgi:hypothetical protein
MCIGLGMAGSGRGASASTLTEVACVRQVVLVGRSSALGAERRYACQLQTGLITNSRLVFKSPSSSSMTFGRIRRLPV